jgi:hypothetical protein
VRSNVSLQVNTHRLRWFNEANPGVASQHGSLLMDLKVA